MKVRVKVAQACPTLCDPMDYKVHGILQARILEWVAFPSPGDLPNPGIEPRSPHSRQILYQLSHKGSYQIQACSYGYMTGQLTESGGTEVKNMTLFRKLADQEDDY